MTRITDTRSDSNGHRARTREHEGMRAVTSELWADAKVTT